MLVLSRKVNEEIIIGDNIRVRLVKIGGGRARLGISAPPEVSVRRAELAKKTPSLVSPIQAAASEPSEKLFADH
jgi:carbon storage regulator CsrA